MVALDKKSLYSYHLHWYLNTIGWQTPNSIIDNNVIIQCAFHIILLWQLRYDGLTCIMLGKNKKRNHSFKCRFQKKQLLGKFEQSNIYKRVIWYVS